MDQKKLIFKKDKKVVKEIYWHKNFNSSTNIISLVNYIDKNSITLRQKLLNFFDEIENSNKSLINDFYIEKNFNYWSLTNFSEKNLYKKNHFFKILKSLVLLDISDDIVFDDIIININDKDVVNILKNKFKNKNIVIQKRIENKVNKNFIYEIISLFKAIIFIFSKIFYTKKKNKYDQNRNLFISFSAYINLNFLKKKKFASLFWGNINNISKCNFLHLFIENEKIKTFNNFKKKIFQIKNDNEIHDFLDSYINLKNIFQIIVKSLKIKFRFFLLKKKFIVEYKNLNTVGLIYYDLNQSFLYFNILKKIYYFYLFDSFFKQNKFCADCFFIYENQPWEKSLIYNWKKYNNKKIFGVINSSVRFWDLRYSKANINSDYILTNGKDSYEKLLDFNFDKSSIKIVESLRYNFFEKNNSLKKTNKVLVVLDYLDKSNLNLLNVLDKSNQLKSYGLKFQKHPLKKNINLKSYSFNVIENNMNDTIYDFVICTNRTTAAVEYYLRGFKVAIILENNFFNFSPLKGYNACKFFKDHNDLDDIIKKITCNTENNDNINFFKINKELPIWKEVLNESNCK